MDGGVGYVDVDALKATELRLGLPGSDEPSEKPPTPTTTTTAARPSKRSLDEDRAARREPSEGGRATSTRATKAQVVGWPPIRSYRKNSFQAMKTEVAGLYVKVSMDGAPYLRKIDLEVYKGYKELREALEDMFKCFEGCKGSEYAITYEDKDGDLMLVGDVPWEMFTSSCKKLRIIRGAEAIRGLGSSQ
ncbi:hypothetical protein B296_00014929 [Ensete ventricosum]|uniref:Auxin-responsive protein n=1 Tax=Ensete ventricosum TaxID=4639 RepID=A0A426Z793_ENSVE|nr:hypothetical protein B296_00014929 [Ensete ventricosum]